MKKKEIYWLFFTLGAAFATTILFFGMDGFKSDSTLEINLHDTYYVTPNSNFVFLNFILIFFGIYLIRAIRGSFKNLTVNLILILSTILLTLICSRIILILEIFSLPYNTIENATLNREKNPAEYLMAIFSKLLLGFQFLLLILLAFCGFKTGRNYQTKK